MTLALVIVIVLSILWLLGEMIPSYPANTKIPSVPSTDLRVSEFAPDFFLALDTARAYVDKEPERKAKKTEDKLTEIRNRKMQHNDTMYRAYNDKITEIKTRRMKEGNPVTKKNPIDPDEMPLKPYNHF